MIKSIDTDLVDVLKSSDLSKFEQFAQKCGLCQAQAIPAHVE